MDANLIQLAERLTELAYDASNMPWKMDDRRNVGDNWLIGFGSDDEADWIITTDNVRASEFTGCGAKADAELVVALVNNLPAILSALRAQAKAG